MTEQLNWAKLTVDFIWRFFLLLLLCCYDLVFTQRRVKVWRNGDDQCVLRWFQVRAWGDSWKTRHLGCILAETLTSKVEGDEMFQKKYRAQSQFWNSFPGFTLEILMQCVWRGAQESSRLYTSLKLPTRFSCATRLENILRSPFITPAEILIRPNVGQNGCQWSRNHKY